MGIDEFTAYCGLPCGTCPIYAATRVADHEEQARIRTEIAEFVSERYNTNMQPEDVDDCDGCRAESGRLFSGCANCEIRKCARVKSCLTCAHCPEYVCDKLAEFFGKEPIARKHLEEIRAGL